MNKLCHGTTNLRELPASKHKRRKERRFVCEYPGCGLHWQYTDHYYQVSVPHGNGKRKQRAVTMTDNVHKILWDKYGGQQAYFDACLKRDGIE